MHAAIADKREEPVELCRRFGVARLDVFGFAARGTGFDPETSDADFLLEFRLDNGRAPLRHKYSERPSILDWRGSKAGHRAIDEDYIQHDLYLREFS